MSADEGSDDVEILHVIARVPERYQEVQAEVELPSQSNVPNQSNAPSQSNSPARNQPGNHISAHHRGRPRNRLGMPFKNPVINHRQTSNNRNQLRSASRTPHRDHPRNSIRPSERGRFHPRGQPRNPIRRQFRERNLVEMPFQNPVILFRRSQFRNAYQTPRGNHRRDGQLEISRPRSRSRSRPRGRSSPRSRSATRTRSRSRNPGRTPSRSLRANEATNRSPVRSSVPQPITTNRPPESNGRFTDFAQVADYLFGYVNLEGILYKVIRMMRDDNQSRAKIAVRDDCQRRLDITLNDEFAEFFRIINRDAKEDPPKLQLLNIFVSRATDNSLTRTKNLWLATNEKSRLNGQTLSDIRQHLGTSSDRFAAGGVDTIVGRIQSIGSLLCSSVRRWSSVMTHRNAISFKFSI